MKSFEVKVYGYAGAYQTTLKTTERISDFNFDASINSGQGNVQIELNKSFSDTTYSIGDFIQVTGYTDYNPNGIVLYTGSVNRIERKYTSGIETIVLDSVGLTGIMTYILFNQSGLVFNKTQDPAITIRNALDYISTKYPWFTHGANLQNYGTSVNIDFSYTDTLEAIKLCANTTDFWWYVRPSGEFYFQAIPVTPTHKLTAGKEIDSITVQEDGERIVNNYYLTWKSGTNTGSDAPSITTYGQRDLFNTDTRFASTGTADEAIANYLSLNKDFKKKTRIRVNNSYNIESINPGETVSVRNFDYSITNLQIQKIRYTVDYMELELQEFDTLAKEIFT